jgi:hypothetical protein
MPKDNPDLNDDTTSMDPKTSCPSVQPPPTAARPVNAPARESPLTEEDFALLRRALAGRGPVQKAARTARFSAGSILVIGVAGLPIAVLWQDWLGLITVAGICTIGVIEHVGARKMQRGEVSAAAFLGRNQLVFLGLIVAYCVLQMVTLSSAAARGELLSADLRSSLAQLEDTGINLDSEVRAWAPLATYGFYSLIIVLSLCFQGGLAVYYFTRKRHLQAVAAATPAWVQRLFRELGV